MRIITRLSAHRLLTALVLSLASFSCGSLHAATNTWNPAGALAQAREGSAAVLLSDGRVLITGGAATGALASTEFFNPDGSFSAGPPMLGARTRHTGVVLQDKRVLVAGGIGENGLATNAAEIYDPATNAWTAVAGGMTLPRADHTASLLKDGRVLIAGGATPSGATDTLEIFSPEANTFTAVTQAVLSSQRQQHAAAVLADGRVLIAGGSDGSHVLNTADVFDPSSNSVSMLSPMSTARVKLSATTLLDGTVLIAGGNDGSADLAGAEIFDPKAGVFTATGNLTAARSGHAAFLLPNNNEVLIVGGSSAGTALSASELFVPWDGNFVSTGTLASPRMAAAGSALNQQGQLLLAGGSDGSNPLASAETFNFATITTDAGDYPPGTTVNISGSGWQPGETVTLTLVELPLYDTHGPYTAVADANGNIFNNQFATDANDLNIRFYLTAKGSVSQAQMTFTDGNVMTAIITTGDPCTSLKTSFNLGETVCAGSTVTIQGNETGGYRIQWYAPGYVIGTTAPMRDVPFSGVTNNSLQTDSFQPTVAGTWTIIACKGGNAGTCAKGNIVNGNGTTFTVAGKSNPAFSNLTSSPTITYGTTSITLSGTISAAGPVYPTNGETVTVAIGSVQEATPIGQSGAFSVNFPTSALAASNSPYSITYSYPGDTNLNPAPNNTATTLTVTQAPQAITFDTVSTHTYSDAPFPVSATASSGLAVTFSATAGTCTVNGSTVTITGAGSCSIQASQAGNGNYSAAPNVSQTFIISPALVSISVPNTTVTYDGNSHSVTPTVTPAVSYSLTYTGLSPTSYATTTDPPNQPGSYIVSATVTSPNYSGNGSGTLTIQQKDPGLILALHTGTPEPSTYGYRVYFDLTTADSPCPTGQMQFFVDGQASSTVTLSNSPCTQQPIEFSTATLTPGQHSVYVTYGGDTYYLSGQSASVSHTVIADGTNVALATSATTLYVGDSLTLTATVTPAGTIDNTATVPSGKVQFFDGTTLLGETPLAGNTAVFTIASLAAGPHNIMAAYSSDDGRFTGSSSPVSIETVEQITPAINWPTPADIVYGTALSNTQLNATAIDQHNGGQNVSGTFTYTPAAGTVLPVGQVNLKATFTPDNTGTYASTGATVTLNITPATLTVAADNASRAYGAANPQFTFQYGGFVNGETSSVVTTAPTCTTTADTSSNVGMYKVTCLGAVAPNYAVKYVDGALTIMKADPTVTVTPYNVTYDGNPHTATGSATGVRGESLSGLDLSGTTHINAASYTDTWTFTDTTGNYNNSTGTVSDCINKASATVAVAPYNVTYDGNAHTATGAATGVKGENLSGLDLSGTTHTNAASYTDTWTFTDITGNYNNSTGTVSDCIKKANATVTVTPYNVTYDGNPHTATGTATGVKGESLISGLNVAGTTHTNAASYTDSWTFTDITGNYNNSTGTVSDCIKKANATVTVTPYNVTYDGNPHTATGTATGVKGESLISGLNLAGTTHTNAGIYTADGWAFTDNSGNYNNSSGTVSDTIGKANAIISIIAYSVIYDGNPHSATGTAIGVKGENLSSGLSLAGTTHINAASYNDPWTFTDATGNYNSTNGTATDNIAPAPTSTVLSSQVVAPPSGVGVATVMLTAAVTSTVIPLDGTVTFVDTSNNNAVLGTAQLGSSQLPPGQASIGITTPLSVGTHLITATYNPSPVDPNFQASAPSSVPAMTPTAAITAPGPSNDVFAVNAPVSLTAAFTAVASANPSAAWTVTNPGANPVTNTTTSGSISGTGITGSQSIATTGVYSLSLTFTDGLGGIVIANTVAGSPATIVIYDPSAGFVTGGGWITSPVNAYTANPSLTGKATFGFVSKYQKGATVPTGDTQFTFQVGNLDFHSTSYQWMVISGSLAQYKGTGTINGSGNYNFLLTALDGSLTGSGTPDGFRMKITDANTGIVTYDNLVSSDDTVQSKNTEALGGGSIIIHSK